MVNENNFPSKSLLNSRFCYVLDANAEIYIWVGLNSGITELQMALKTADLLIGQPPPAVKDDRGNEKPNQMLLNSRSSNCIVMKIMENDEPIIFWEKFIDIERILPLNPTKPIHSNIIFSISDISIFFRYTKEFISSYKNKKN